MQIVVWFIGSCTTALLLWYIYILLKGDTKI